MSESRRPSSEDIAVFQQIAAEFARTNPELRKVMSQTGSGAVGLSAPRSDWPAILAALRALPDDAGQSAISLALAPWFSSGEQGV